MVVGRTEKPLARAGAHLSAGRLAEAEGVYRAVLNIDPEEFRAHLGLADCATGCGRVDDAVELLSAGSQRYAEAGSMRPAFALITKALAIAPARLDLHIDVAELEAADGRAEMAALRLENLARTYLSAGQHEEAELVLEAAAAFSAPPPAPEPAVPPPVSRPFVNPHTGHATPPPAPRAAATPPPPPPSSRASAVPKPLHPTPTPIHDMVRPSPLLAEAAIPPAAPPKRAAPVAERKAKRSTRGMATAVAPKWRPSTVTTDPPPRRKKPRRVAVPVAKPSSKVKRTIAPAPRPRKTATPIATVPKKRPSIAPAPSPKRGGKTLDKLPPLRVVADRLRSATSSTRNGPSDEDRTAMWHSPVPTPV
ncbi:MAG: tetratricopeptide repeat protein [Nannocystales bacterium]